MTMAGYIGHAGGWARFERKWARRLKEVGLSHFHCKDFRGRQGEFSGWSDKTYNAFLQRAHRMCEAHTLFGLIARVTHEDYKRHYVTDERPRGIQLDSEYGICFRMCLMVIANMTEKIADPSKVTVHVVMESGHRNAGDAERIFGLAKKQVPRLAQILGTITFADKMDCYPAQAADFLAYAGYRYEQRDAADIRVTDYSYESDTWNQAKAKQANTKRPVFRINIDQNVLGELREGLIAHAEARKQHGKRTAIPSSGASPDQA